MRDSPMGWLDFLRGIVSPGSQAQTDEESDAHISLGAPVDNKRGKHGPESSYNIIRTSKSKSGVKHTDQKIQELLDLGMSFANAGRLDEAIDAYSKAID